MFYICDNIYVIGGVDCIDDLNLKFYNYNVTIEFLKRYPYDYIRTNKSIMRENKY